MAKGNMKVTFNANKETIIYLDLIAKTEGQTRTEVINELIDSYILKHKSKLSMTLEEFTKEKMKNKNKED